MPTNPVTGYINAAPPYAQKHLRELRQIILSVAPKASEDLKWGAPAYTLSRVLVTFCAYRKHANFYPTPAVLQAFAGELKKFETGEGSLRLPYDKPIPAELIRRMTELRLKELTENDAKWM